MVHGDVRPRHLITSLQTLPYLPGLAATTLRALAARQATLRDDFHEREPGKILHELRFGELTARGERPYSPYYGSADATPLFLVLLDEYHRWSGDDELVRALEPNARAALAWITESGDLDGDGYVEYHRRNTTTGLINQCWKDSWDSIQYADGTLAQSPIATCEIQGYVYDAQRRCARLAREVWDDAPLATGSSERAAALRANFQRDFWMPERGHHAVALDRDKRQVDSLTSNIGHLLWSGLLDDAQAAATAEHLLDEPLYSGWGVRTLSAREAGYNPLGYHTGTVWPHDNSLIAAGLARYGFHEAAATIAVRHARRRTPLRTPPARGLRRIPATADIGAGRLPNRLTAAGVVRRRSLLLLTTLLRLEPNDSRGPRRHPRRRRQRRLAPSGTSSPRRHTRPEFVRRMTAVDEAEIGTVIARLARPHASGGYVIGHAAILAEGTDLAAFKEWILAHGGTLEVPSASAGPWRAARIGSGAPIRTPASPVPAPPDRVHPKAAAGRRSADRRRR